MLDIGVRHGKKLGRLAANLCRNVIRGFAAQLLREAIDQAEDACRQDQDEIEKGDRRRPERLKPDRSAMTATGTCNGEDDGSPFEDGRRNGAVTGD